MPVRDTWPYVEKHHSENTDRHVELKNLAVHWLIERGFSTDEIEQEHPMGNVSDQNSGHGFADIYAKQGGVEVFIECETDWHTPKDLATGARLGFERGGEVYVFKDDGIHRVIEETYTIEDKRTREPIERTVYALERHSQLPLLDLTAYKA